VRLKLVGGGEDLGRVGQEAAELDRLEQLAELDLLGGALLDQRAVKR